MDSGQTAGARGEPYGPRAPLGVTPTSHNAPTGNAPAAIVAGWWLCVAKNATTTHHLIGTS